MQYDFNYNNKFSSNGLTLALRKMISSERAPIILCIGTDKISGDSLGPIVGSILLNKLKDKNAFIFGSLDNTLTAKEIKYINYFLKATFKDRTVITVDAAVGEASDVGLIRISSSPLSPGSGFNKNLGEVGNISIQGIVAEKGFLSYSSLKDVRMSTVYKMAESISSSITDYVYNLC